MDNDNFTRVSTDGGESSDTMHKTSAYFRTVVALHDLRDRAKDAVDSLKERGFSDRLHDGWNNTQRAVSSKTRSFFSHPETVTCKHLPEKYNYVFRPKSRWELVLLSGTVCGIEFCYAAETAFVTPILLSLGLSIKFVTMIWCLSPLIGLFLTPVLGSMSDSCESKFGRRRPFIIMYSIGILLGLILVPNGHHIGLALGDTGHLVKTSVNNITDLNGTFQSDISSELIDRNVFDSNKDFNNALKVERNDVTDVYTPKLSRENDEKDLYEKNHVNPVLNDVADNNLQSKEDEFSKLVDKVIIDSNSQEFDFFKNSPTAEISILESNFSNEFNLKPKITSNITERHLNEIVHKQLDEEDIFPNFRKFFVHKSKDSVVEKSEKHLIATQDIGESLNLTTYNKSDSVKLLSEKYVDEQDVFPNFHDGHTNRAKRSVGKENTPVSDVNLAKEKPNSLPHPNKKTSSSQIQPWSIAFTVIGTVLLDFCSDACQSPSRTYLLDVSMPSDHAAGLSTFTVMAGLGGSIGYAMGAIHWETTFFGQVLGGQINAVFMIVTIIFIICLISTVSSFPEIPLSLLKDPKMYKEYQENFEREVPQDAANELDVINTKPKRYGSTDETNASCGVVRDETSIKNEQFSGQTEPESQPQNILQSTIEDLYKTAPDTQDAANDLDIINTKPNRYGSTDKTNASGGVARVETSIKNEELAGQTEPESQLQNVSQHTKDDLYVTAPDTYDVTKDAVKSIEINVAEEIGSANEHPTLKEYLISIIHMPSSLRILCLTNLFCWMSLVCYSLYFTDFVGECVFRGDPLAPEESSSFKLYQEGVQFGCWGMALYSISCSIYSFFIERLVKKIGAKLTYVSGQLVYAVGMVIMAITRHPIAVILLSPTAGVMYSTLFTMPYLLIAHYHCSKKFSNETKQTEIGIRGIGTDVAAVSSMVFLSQFILSLSMGSIIEAIGSNVVPVCAAAILSTFGALSATQVTYLNI